MGLWELISCLVVSMLLNAVLVMLLYRLFIASRQWQSAYENEPVLEEKIHDLDERLLAAGQAWNERLIDMEEKYSAQTSECNELKRSLMAAGSAVSSFKEQNSAIEQALKRSKGLLDEQIINEAAMRKRLQEEINVERRKMLKVVEDLHTSEDAMTRMQKQCRKEIDDVHKTLLAFETDFEERRKKMSGIIRENAIIQDALVKKEVELRSANDRISDLEDMRVDLRKKNNRLKAELRTWEEAAEGIEASV